MNIIFFDPSKYRHVFRILRYHIIHPNLVIITPNCLICHLVMQYFAKPGLNFLIVVIRLRQAKGDFKTVRNKIFTEYYRA